MSKGQRLPSAYQVDVSLVDVVLHTRHTYKEQRMHDVAVCSNLSLIGNPNHILIFNILKF
jgi:hypothetical protein